MTETQALSFGEELRRERVVREIPLEEIAAATKISLRLLTALEKSDLSRLPAPTFTRGFIRAYARHIGIDPDEKVNAYLADLAGGAPEAPGAKSARPRSRFWRGRRSTAGMSSRDCSAKVEWASCMPHVTRLSTSGSPSKCSSPSWRAMSPPLLQHTAAHATSKAPRRAPGIARSRRVAKESEAAVIGMAQRAPMLSGRAETARLVHPATIAQSRPGRPQDKPPPAKARGRPPPSRPGPGRVPFRSR